MSNTSQIITISLEKYNELLESDRFLRILEECGVDNWEGYDYAWEIMKDNDE